VELAVAGADEFDAAPEPLEFDEQPATDTVRIAAKAITESDLLIDIE